jgi:hypothetical protein
MGRLPAQPIESGRPLFEIQERIKSYSEEALARQSILNREAEIMRLLAESADSISTFATGASYSRALSKLGEARRIALGEPVLPEPIPSVLRQVGELLERQPAGTNPAQVKGQVFRVISQVQEDLVQRTEQAQNEISLLEQLQSALGRPQNGLRAAAISSLRAAIHAETLAVK